MFKVGDTVLFVKSPDISDSYWGREATVVEVDIPLRKNITRIKYYDLEGNIHENIIGTEYITKATKLHKAMK